MDIQPASLPQIVKGRKGRTVLIDNDAFDISKRLQEVSTSLKLAWNEFGEYFVVYQVLPDGEENLVTTWDPAQNGAPDGRLIERVQQVMQPSYDYAAELDRIDREADAQKDREFTEKVGPYAERLYHAVRKDMGVKERIYIPGYSR